MTADRWSVFFVHLARLAKLREIFVTSQDGASKPHCVTLDDILKYVTCHWVVSTWNLVKGCHSLIEDWLNLGLETTVKALEKCGATWKNNIFIEFDSVLNRTRLDGIIEYLSERLHKIFVHKLGMEEHFRSKEAFITNIDFDEVVVQSAMDKLLELIRLN